MPKEPSKATDASGKALLKTYRKAFSRAVGYLRKQHAGAPQQSIGWVMTRVSKAITDDPFKKKKDLYRLIDSLIAQAPQPQ